MPTYADVRLKAEVIGRLAKLFGFSDAVKICYYLPEKAGDKIGLRFVVNEGTKPISYENDTWLGAKLSAELGCDVGITVYESVDHDQYDTDRRSALITDEKAIKEVIYRINNRMDSEAPLSKKDIDAISAIKLEDIECKNIPEDDKWLQEGLLKQADEYLKKNAPQETQSASSAAYNKHGLLPDKKHLNDVSPEEEPQKKKLRATAELNKGKNPSPANGHGSPKP